MSASSRQRIRQILLLFTMLGLLICSALAISRWRVLTRDLDAAQLKIDRCQDMVVRLVRMLDEKLVDPSVYQDGLNRVVTAEVLADLSRSLTPVTVDLSRPSRKQNKKRKRNVEGQLVIKSLSKLRISEQGGGVVPSRDDRSGNHVPAGIGRLARLDRPHPDRQGGSGNGPRGVAALPGRGFAYTQFCDVEQERNGLINFDRTPKLRPAGAGKSLDPETT